jgi:hypothetical protein
MGYGKWKAWHDSRTKELEASPEIREGGETCTQVSLPHHHAWPWPPGSNRLGREGRSALQASKEQRPLQYL